MKLSHSKLLIALAAALVVISIAAIARELWPMNGYEPGYGPTSASSSAPRASAERPSPIAAPERRYPATPVEITQTSPAVLAYAHGTAQADGRIFIGMANRDGNPFRTNEIVVFMDLADLRAYRIISLPGKGDIETMAYDAANDKIYFAYSKPGSLDVMKLDPRTFAISELASSTSIDIGEKPAIATDGAYVYGITDTKPSTVFKIRLADGAIEYDKSGHIPHGHSMAAGAFGSTTELYVADSTYDQFEKIDGATLRTIGKVRLPPCAATDDMPFMPAGPGDGYGHVYIGCEKARYGLRVRTSDLAMTRFDLPGASFGLFAWNGDLYNAAADGMIDVFPGADIHRLARYSTGTDMQLNELFFASSTKDMYFTAWWGAKGLREVRVP